MSVTNRQIRLAARPSGLPDDSHWNLTEEPLPDPQEGQFVVRTTHISLDPAMRGWMNEGQSYIDPVAIGAVMRAGTVGEVVASEHPGFAVGDHVSGALGVQTYAVTDGAGVYKVDPSLAPLPTYLGTLGHDRDDGVLRVAGRRPAQRGRHGGRVRRGRRGRERRRADREDQGVPRVVGIAGGPEKCDGSPTSSASTRRSTTSPRTSPRRCARIARTGIDVYFDNVGGEILDAALTRIGRGARIVICGAVSQYNAGAMRGPSNYLALLVFRASMTGMVVFDWADRYGEAAAELAGYLADGRLISREDVVPGTIDDFPATLLKLFRGENTGKLVLELTG